VAFAAFGATSVPDKVSDSACYNFPIASGTEITLRVPIALNRESQAISGAA